MPSYMKEFKCIGTACEDSCCLGWAVEIDKETYTKYKNNQHDELKSLFRSNVKTKDDSRNKVSYGIIKMEKGRCPFLNEQKLCDIHSKLGEEHLSNTCAIYPRSINKVDGKLEKSATMSCPEVTRVALLNPEGMMFEQVEEEIKARTYLNNTFDSSSQLFSDKPQQYFWDIRLFGLSVLQNRSFSLDERLIIIGMAYENIIKIDNEKQYNIIPNILQQIDETIETKAFKEQLKEVPDNCKIQMLIAKELTYKKMQEGTNNIRYIECLDETLHGLIQSEDDGLENMTNRYQESYKNYLQPYLKEKEYILENYLVNEFFRMLMPFGSFSSIWDSYIFLCVIYSMLKLHLIGMARYHQGLTDELTLKLIQSFSKVVIHNNKYIQNIIKLIKENKYDSLAYMTMLVKN